MRDHLIDQLIELHFVLCPIVEKAHRLVHLHPAGLQVASIS